MQLYDWQVAPQTALEVILVPRADDGRRARSAGDRPAITAWHVIDTAMWMTAEHGLQGWSIRALAAELNVWPTVIYHHVGDRETVLDEVTDRVVSRMPCPHMNKPWRDWFSELLRDGRKALRRYPGVARRLTLQGPTVPSALHIIDCGVRVLENAGFGDEAPPIYSMLLNGAFLLTALDDDHDRTPSTHQRAAEALGAFRDNRERPGLAALGRYVHGSELSPEHVHDFNEDFYDYYVERLLDGASVRLEVIRVANQQRRSANAQKNTTEEGVRMIQQHNDSTVRVLLQVPMSPAEAFAKFTEGFGDWWPEKQGFTGAPLETVGFEPREGARWIERTIEGSELKWGRVLVWQPPERLVLSWELTSDWSPTDDLAQASEVEVRFDPAADGFTKVELVHSHFDRHGDGGDQMREAMASESEGWPYLMDSYRRCAGGS